MAKKKVVPAKITPPEAEPTFLSFLKSPEIVSPTPTSWLDAPVVTVGNDRVGDAIRRKPGPLLPETIREVSEPAPSAPAPVAFVPSARSERTKGKKRAKKSRLAKSKKVIRECARAAGQGKGSLEPFCKRLDAEGILPDPTWGCKTWVDAYEKPTLHSAIRGVKDRHS